MKEIPVGDQVALVDDEDYERLSQFRWHIVKGKRTVYAARSLPGGGQVRMHREIMPGVAMIDHANGDGLDNRRQNLRPATRRQNGANTGKIAGTSSRFKGVTWDKGKKRWRAQIKAEDKLVYLGAFVTQEQAAAAYNEAAKELFGEFALLNRIDRWSSS